MTRWLPFCFFSIALLIGCAGLGQGMPAIQTVFVIVLENKSWVDVKGAANAPYLNQTLLPMASHCEGYYNLPGPLHPSLPNYLWLEVGTNFGILDDNNPDLDHLNVTNHLSTLLDHAGISWKAYLEGISGTTVPLVDGGGYAVRHDPFVYFDDVTGTNDPSYAFGIAHLRPYTELKTDLLNNTVPRYNFIVPNGCHNGHDSCPPIYDGLAQSDAWLAAEVPAILNSAAYQNGGALFITFDECAGVDPRIGMIVLSPQARGAGYSNTNYYTHSSLLKTVQEIFDVRPFLGDAANATDLSDLFLGCRFSSIRLLPNGVVRLISTGLAVGKTNIVEASADLQAWVAIATNAPAGTTLTNDDTSMPVTGSRFYRLKQLP
jgi:hypothetical protein